MNNKVSEQQSRFLIVIVFLIGIFIFFAICRSFYLSLNLCGRESVRESLRAEIIDLIQKDLTEYMFEREKIFEEMYQEKKSILCMQQQSDDTVNPLLDYGKCTSNSSILDRNVERKEFRNEIQEILHTYPQDTAEINLKNAQGFYLKKLRHYWNFSLNQDYEKIIEILTPELEHLEKEAIEKDKNQDDPNNIHSYISLSFGIDSVIFKTLHDNIKFIIDDIETIDNVWTIWSGKRQCKAQIQYPDASFIGVIDYYSISNSRTSGKVISYRYIGQIVSVKFENTKLENQAEIGQKVLHNILKRRNVIEQ